MIEFTRGAYDDVVAHAIEGREAADPVEVCGVLAGRFDEDGDRSTVTETHRASNAAETPRTRYLIDPEEQFAILEAIEAAGDEVVGFYHSHPTGPPYPSETDAADATWPGRSYVICALDGQPFVGSWRWQGESAADRPDGDPRAGERDGFRRETVAVVPETG
ncbi:desampylase [Halopenitus persicus]|uniref:Proteasome lid subunit RPN8/RPN11, contains Jab1/MPN metalloenzyme (JAMM) motif n=1 Tax=Halopenitus persicus TaxID=1048396 RepID=A0A1H3DJQ9_9EURY|nr:desampylase [Halopenitus persicus]QHS16279.1 M67 family metallopeptidase [haloarchaeon 3A1-DGR]SDX66752.1 Proteasome lid subunit RPN8/RPN11, contains Jab1/MPN metalloenzyme (JAMM) motif [Halopenitus persicus]